MSGKKKNILYIVHRVPFPPDRGDRIRSYHLLRFLASRANIWLATLSDEPLHPDCESELNSLCEAVCIQPLNRARYLKGALSLAQGKSATEGLFYSHKLKTKIEEWCQQVTFDGAIGFCSSVAPYLQLEGLRDTPKLIDLVDVDSEKFKDYSESSSGPKRVLYDLESKRLRSLEVTLGEQCQGVTLVTEPEADLYRSFAPKAKVRAAMNGIDLDFFNPEEEVVNSIKEEQAGTCLFVGALDYLPNVRGVSWFCENVWPSILQELPQSRFLVVGRNPVPEIKRLQSIAGVDVHGNVPDVRPFYQQASVSIAPLHIARGVQNKVLEAFAMRTAVLATKHAIEGINVEHEQVAIATTPEEWADSLLELFRNREKREVVAEAGSEFVKLQHNWSSCLQPVADLLNL